jgi:4-amino-4-deoxy-L-arabinose transferase-like glycosyltransferase
MQKLLSLPNLIVVLIVVIPALFMLNAGRGDSAIFDETAHIVAGYTYLKHLDYRFNPEHPMLVKMIAGLPLIFQNFNFSTEKGYWSGVNEQWWAGNEFLYKSGNDADKIIFSARIGPIILALILIIFVYIWAKTLIGRWWALLPAFFTAFSPLVLAHGHYVTTDIGATLSILLSIYFFIKYLQFSSGKNLLLASFVFGLAQSIKFSAILLVPYLFFIAGIFALVSKRSFLKYLFSTLIAIVIGYLIIVYPLYLLATWNYPIEKQIADTTAVIQNFGIPFLAHLNIQMAENKVLRPLAHYFFGVLMVLQRSAGGNNAFFLGELSSHGWWYYFPLMYLMKEPLPSLFFVLIGFILGIWKIFAALTKGFKKAYRALLEYLNIHFTEFSMVAFIALYWATSIASPLNIGVRHILPTIPLFYLLSAGAIRRWFAFEPPFAITTFKERLINFIHAIFNGWVKLFILSALIIWLIIGTVLAAPHFLSFFNELFGGKTDGFYYATDSNFDWGQDLKRLKKWTQEYLEPEEKIAVDYFGGGDVKYYLGERAEPWWSARGNPKDEGINWLAISTNTLQGATARLAPDFYRNPADEYLWLENPYSPADRAGTSIFIYKL